MDRLQPALRAGARRSPVPGAVDGARSRLALDFGYSRAAWGAGEGSGDALLDVGVHLVDLARWLTGSDVVGVRAARVEELEAELDLELDRGSASISCGVDRSYRERVDVRDGSGHRSGGTRQGVVCGRWPRRLRRGGAHSLVPSLELELGRSRRRARGEPAPLLATAADGLAAMEAIDAARAVSRRQSRMTPLHAGP